MTGEFVEKIPEKRGEGFPGLDLNSGWNWTPIKNGWLGSSTICTHNHNYQNYYYYYYYN